jgi:hypothetical protein
MPADYQGEDVKDVAISEKAHGPLVTLLGAAKSSGIVPLAFTITQDLRPIEIDGLAISWTKEAISTFVGIRDEATFGEAYSDLDLPYASLRTLVELALGNVSRIEPEVGLSKYALDPTKKAPFVYLEGGDANEAHSVLSPLLNDWIVNFLVPQYAKPGMVPKRLQHQMIDLAGLDRLLSIERIHTQLLPWNQGPTGTAAPPHKNGFQLLADRAARLLAGNELFRSLGPVRRILSRRSGQSLVELITDPIEVDDRGAFSLIVRLEVVTFASVRQPVLTIDVHKRRWLRRFAGNTFDHNAITGTVFSSARPYIAANFHLRRKRCDDGKWRWIPDSAFQVLRRDLSLPLKLVDGNDIARGEASTTSSRVLLVHRDAIADGRHGIKLGVPEVDKLEAFDAAARILASTGIVPFGGYKRLQSSHGKDHEAISRMINMPTLLSAVLEEQETGSFRGFEPAYLKTLSEAEIDFLLRREFRIGLDKIRGGTRVAQYENGWGRLERDQSIDLDVLIAANRKALESLYPGEKPLLYIFHENEAGPELLVLKSVVRLLWGGALDITLNHLPADAHGPQSALPGKNLRNAKRAALRVEAWRSYAEQIAKNGRRTFCLIMASDLYSDPSEVSLRRRDDRVNKPAARQALSTIGGACVQYLRPLETSSDRTTVDLTGFLLRAQAAMKDLISAHSGRIDGVRDAVLQCFDTDEMRVNMPREVIGITVVRRNRGRTRGGIGTTFLPIAVSIDVETGRCDMCCAYEDRSGFTMTRWERFPEALATISRISPVRLAGTREVARTRFMTFVDRIISASVDNGARPVVIVDSSNCAQLWSWLQDQRIDVSKIEIGQKQWMQDNWKGARIIRIRQDLAPGIVERKEQHVAFTSIHDTRPKHALTADLRIEVPSSPFGLLRLDSANCNLGCVSYLSVGRKTLLMNKRGPSCYRPTEWAIPMKTNDGAKRSFEHAKNFASLPMYSLEAREPWVGQWPTPNPLEIVVTFRAGGDDPDRLAELVEHLRYGFGHYSEWTILPAPLFFERVVRDYISSFSLEDMQDEEDGGENYVD